MEKMKQVEGLFFTNLLFVGERQRTGIHMHHVPRDAGVARFFAGAKHGGFFEALQFFRDNCKDQSEADRMYVAFSACQGNPDDMEGIPQPLKDKLVTWCQGHSIGQWYWNMALADIVSWPKAIPAHLKDLHIGHTKEDCGRVIHDIVKRAGHANRELVLFFILKVNVNWQRVQRKVSSSGPVNYATTRKWIVDADYGYYDRAVQSVVSYLSNIKEVSVFVMHGSAYKRAKQEDCFGQRELRSDFYEHFDRNVPSFLPKHNVFADDVRFIRRLLGAYVWAHCLHGMASFHEHTTRNLRIQITRDQ